MFNKMTKIIPLQKKGYTLIEVLIVITIIGFIGSLILNFTVSGFKLTRFESEQAEAVKQARDVMDIMKKEIRGANASAKGDYTLSLINSDEFEFYSDINDDDIYEKVHYYNDDTQMKKEVINPGLSNNYDGTSTISVIAEYVNNQAEPIFTYFDSNYNETANITDVRLINIRFKINVTPEIAPADIYVETDVTLRNLKSNL